MARYTTPGTLFQININGTFTNVDGVENISGPDGDKPEIDGTALADTAAVYGDGTPDYGQVQFSVFDNPADAGNARLLTRFNATNVTDQFKIILPFSGSGNTLAFNGFVKSWSVDLQKAAFGKYNCTVRCTGAVART